jgi:dolichol-phosphate hexosyltransferase
VSITTEQFGSIDLTKPRLVRTPPPDEPRPTKLSIVMPVYNERQTIAAAVAQVLRTDLPCDFELIVVDDGSTDGTSEILRALRHPAAKVIEHPQNFGKGAALQTGAQAASGTHFVPFDADLEYDPEDLKRLIAPVMRGRCDVVYGVRLFGANTRYQSYRHALGNKALTLVASLLFDASLTDLHTCLKLLPVGLFRELELQEDGFGLDTEITAKLLARGIAPFEIPVSYHSRSSAHGKKITWRDGVECLQVLARVRAGRQQREVTPTLSDPLDVLASSIRAVSELVPDDPQHPDSGGEIKAKRGA